MEPLEHWKRQLTGWVRTACIMEVQCPRPGNVSPTHGFSDLASNDFLNSAEAIAPVIAEVGSTSVGAVVLESIRATRQVVSSNTNLGIVLLLSPLAAVSPEQSLAEGIDEVLCRLSVQDSADVYAAIRLAAPAGLGEVSEQDLHTAPTLPLRECMKLAAGHDLIARQYANGFRQVLKEGCEWLLDAGHRIESQPQQIQWVALRLLAEYGDSLIARKCGNQMSDEVRLRAGKIIADGWPEAPAACEDYRQLDHFLRADGNRRNPGTTADLIAAILFASLREGHLTPQGDWWIPQSHRE